jgi:hypothetical protein
MEAHLDALRDVSASRDLTGLVVQLNKILPAYNLSAGLLQWAITPPRSPFTIQ